MFVHHEKRTKPEPTQIPCIILISVHSPSSRFSSFLKCCFAGRFTLSIVTVVAVSLRWPHSNCRHNRDNTHILHASLSRNGLSIGPFVWHFIHVTGSSQFSDATRANRSTVLHTNGSALKKEATHMMWMHHAYDDICGA